MDKNIEETIPLDDFVEYIEDHNTSRLPETRMGKKLKNSLKKSGGYVDIYNTKNISSLDVGQAKIVEAVEDFFKEAEATEEGPSTNYITSVFNLLENILNYPYEDEHRIIHLDNYSGKEFLQNLYISKVLY